MKEATDLMAALRRLIEAEDEATDGYFEAGMALSQSQYLPFGTCMFLAGQSHDITASCLRDELAALELKYGSGN